MTTIIYKIGDANCENREGSSPIPKYAAYAGPMLQTKYLEWLKTINITSCKTLIGICNVRADSKLFNHTWRTTNYSSPKDRNDSKLSLETFRVTTEWAWLVYRQSKVTANTLISNEIATEYSPKRLRKLHT